MMSFTTKVEGGDVIVMVARATIPKGYAVVCEKTIRHGDKILLVNAAGKLVWEEARFQAPWMPHMRGRVIRRKAAPKRRAKRP